MTKLLEPDWLLLAKRGKQVVNTIKIWIETRE